MSSQKDRMCRNPEVSTGQGQGGGLLPGTWVFCAQQLLGLSLRKGATGQHGHLPSEHEGLLLSSSGLSSSRVSSLKRRTKAIVWFPSGAFSFLPRAVLVQ